MVIQFSKYPSLERQDLTQNQLGAFKFTPVDVDVPIKIQHPGDSYYERCLMVSESALLCISQPISNLFLTTFVVGWPRHELDEPSRELIYTIPYSAAASAPDFSGLSNYY